MSEPEKPLRAKVAEALGWRVHYNPAWTRCPECHAPREAFRWPDQWVGLPADEEEEIFPCPVPKYDTSWEATGPLIEKYKIDPYPVLVDAPGGATRGPREVRWYAWAPLTHIDADEAVEGEGPTPLIAVCELLLKLSAAGKL